MVSTLQLIVLISYAILRDIMNKYKLWFFALLSPCAINAFSLNPHSLEPESKTQPPSEVEEQCKRKNYQELAEEFKNKLQSFGSDNGLIEGKYKIFHDYTHDDPTKKIPSIFFCRCKDIVSIRHFGMARFVEEIEKSIEDELQPIAFLIFLGSGNLVSEFILLDALLTRNPQLRVAIDFIDPVYNQNESTLKTIKVATFLSRSLEKKYPEQILAYKLRFDDFSAMPNGIGSMNFLLNEVPILITKNNSDAFNTHKSKNPNLSLNPRSSLFKSRFLKYPFQNTRKKIIVLSAFDLPPEEPAQAYEIVKDVLFAINNAQIAPGESEKLRRIFPKPHFWQLLSVSVGQGRIVVEDSGPAPKIIAQDKEVSK